MIIVTRKESFFFFWPRCDQVLLSIGFVIQLIKDFINHWKCSTKEDAQWPHRSPESQVTGYRFIKAEAYSEPSRTSSRFWEIILVVSFNSLSQQTKIFSKLAKTSLVSPQLMLLLKYQAYFCALVLKSKIFIGISFRKVQVFTINRKELRHIFPWKLERLSSCFSKFL